MGPNLVPRHVLLNWTHFLKTLNYLLSLKNVALSSKNAGFWLDFELGRSGKMDIALASWQPPTGGALRWLPPLSGIHLPLMISSPSSHPTPQLSFHSTHLLDQAAHVALS